MDREAVPQPQAMVVPALEGHEDLHSHQCGRCRRMFADDPTLDAMAREDWSLCPSCAAALFPRRARSSTSLTVVRDQ